MFVAAPVGMQVRSSPYRCADSMMKSVAVCCSTLRLAVGISISPMPFPPWMKAESSLGVKESVVSEWPTPANTGTSVRPSSSRTASELRTDRPTVTLPYVAVMPMRSSSGLPRA